MTLYGQFGAEARPAQVLSALKMVGFDSVYDMSWMCEMLSRATDAMLSEAKPPWPKISVTCPAIVRLIQIRYPEMLPNLVPIETARELAAKLVRRRLVAEKGLKPQEIGIFFVTPCTAIMNSILHPVGLERSYLDGAISMAELHGPMRTALKKLSGTDTDSTQVSARGALWALAGGEIASMRDANTVTVCGVHDVTRIFDRLEAGTYQTVDFVEAYMCSDGCVGGGLTVEGPFVAQRSIQRIVRWLEGGRGVNEEQVRSMLLDRFFDMETEIGSRAIEQIPKDLRKAVARKKERAAMLARLPGKNCGACGSPDCATLVEDVLKGEATLEDCVFLKIRGLEEALAVKKGGGT
jgi:hypothetical protein